jgi:flagellar basal body-associated protein FliL
MSGAIPWIMISVAVILVAVGVIVFLFTRKKKRPIDYYAIFILGICLLPVGIPTGNYAISALGIIYMVLGLVHKKDWKKNRPNWKKMSKSEKNFQIAIIIVLVVLLIGGVVAFILFEKKLSKNYTIGVNCPNGDCSMPGSSCGTVTPGYNDQCCEERNKDTAHIQCVGNWRYNSETNQCIFYCK